MRVLRTYTGHVEIETRALLLKSLRAMDPLSPLIDRPRSRRHSVDKNKRFQG